MALFIKRLADLLNDQETGSLNDLPAYDGVPDYPDVSPTDVGAQAIGQLTQAGIVGGFPDGTYRPNAPVSRRQMAAFVNRLQDFLTGSPYSTSGDYFDDDNGDPGEDDLNALASVGIFQGDGAGNVNPGGNLTRRQMANILLRDAQVLFASDLVTSPFTPPSEGNATLDVTPTTAATIELATEPSTDDDRTYTVTEVTPGTTYTIQLFPAANVQGTSTFTFTEAGMTNTADEGSVAADITVVNGVNQPAADDDATTLPVGDQITFTVDGVSTEEVVPVVYEDADSDSNLDLNADNTPVDAEAFGVGGAIEFVPAEAASGAPAAGTVTLVSGTDYAVLDDTTTVFFNSGDTYRIESGGFYNEATPAVFFQNLSIGDTLFTCQTNVPLPDTYTQGAANEFCLTDTEPAEPTSLTAAAGTPADTAVDLDWTASTNPSVSAYRVYSNDEACTDTTAGELGLVATVDAPAVTYTATGLTPATPYCFVVTSVSGSDESPVAVDTPNLPGDNTAEITTAGLIDAPTILTAVLTNDAVVVDDADEDDVWTLELSETMDLPAGTTFDLVDPDGDTIRVQCGLAVDTNDNLTSATCSLGNGANPTLNDTVTITLEEDAEDRNGAGDGTVDYDLTITDTTLIVDDDDGAEPNLGTGDVVIN
jgi:hypothetical protein